MAQSSSIKTSPIGTSGYQILSIEDLSGGLDLKKAATLLKPNRSRLCRNWSLREPGALIVMPGWETFSTTPFGTGRAQGGNRIYLANQTPFTLVAANGNVYRHADSGVPGAPVSTGWHATNPIFFPYDRDLVMVLDGATPPQKSTDGTTWTRVGIAAPGAPTPAPLAGGALVLGSTYEFSYSGRDDALQHEGNEGGVATHVTTAGNLAVRLTLGWHPDPQVDSLVVYARDVTAGELVRRRVGTVANTNPSVTFDVTTNTWGSGVEAPTDSGMAPVLDFAVVWKNRWWGKHATLTNRIHFTQIFEPQAWSGLFYIDIPFAGGDEIAAMQPLGDTLIIYGTAGNIFLIIGQTSLDFEVRPSGAAQAGALGQRAVDTVEDGQVHAAVEGIYLFDGATDRLLSNDIDGFAPSAVGWRQYIDTASVDTLARTALVYDKGEKTVKIATTNLWPFDVPGEWVLDLNRTRLQEVPAWTTSDRAIGGYLKWDGNEPVQGNRGRLFAWTLATAELTEERVGTSADGDDMTAEYAGAVFSAGAFIASYPDGFIEFEPNDGDLEVAIVVDRIRMGVQAVNIGGGLSFYGTARYGTAQYAGAGRLQRPLVWPLGAEGHTIQFRAGYVGQAPFRWFTYRLGVIPEPVPSGI